MVKTKNPFVGSWRVVEMEVWGPDYLDLIVPAHLTFEDERQGSFQFGAVKGWMDCRHGEREGQPLVEFSWQGHNDADEAGGRGWALLKSEIAIAGHLYIHDSDDSWFRAKRKGATPRK